MPKYYEQENAEVMARCLNDDCAKLDQETEAVVDADVQWDGDKYGATIEFTFDYKCPTCGETTKSQTYTRDDSQG